MKKEREEVREMEMEEEEREREEEEEEKKKEKEKMKKGGKRNAKNSRIVREANAKHKTIRKRKKLGKNILFILGLLFSK